MSSNQSSGQFGKCPCTPEEHLVDLPISPLKTLNRHSHTGDMPSIQSSPVKRFIDTAQRAISTIHEKKSLLKRSIEMLDEQEAELKAGIRTHQTALSQSTLGRIPDETLGRIFVYAQGESYIDFTSLWPLLPTTIAMSQVCRRWRWIGIAKHPDLWSRICLTAGLPWNEKGNHNPFISQLSLCLWRSGNHTLAIRINGSGDGSGKDLGYKMNKSEDLHDSIRKPPYQENSYDLPWFLLKAHIHRVTRLEIDLHPGAHAWTVIEYHNLSFPSLTSLEISDLGTTQTYISFSKASSLTRLSLKDAVWDERIGTALPVKKLAWFKVEGSALFAWSKILQRAQGLHELHWIYDGCRHYPDLKKFSKKNIILRNLRRFDAVNVPGQALRANLTQLHFLVLERLSLNLETFFTNSFYGFITSDSLTALSLVFNAYGGSKRADKKPKHIEKFLGFLPKIAPKLKSFSLTFQSIQEAEICPAEAKFHHGFVAIIKSMMATDRRHFMELETLKLSDMSFSVMHEPLLRLIRGGSVKTLKEITVVFLDPTLPDLLSDFKDQMGLASSQAGVTVNISTTRYEGIWLLDLDCVFAAVNSHRPAC